MKSAWKITVIVSITLSEIITTSKFKEGTVKTRIAVKTEFKKYLQMTTQRVIL